MRKERSPYYKQQDYYKHVQQKEMKFFKYLHHQLALKFDPYIMFPNFPLYFGLNISSPTMIFEHQYSYTTHNSVDVHDHAH